eukprot:TRINITY_DN21742_c0_g1_i1.p1 TRINITY_DN21742_c0_g1~~TRINITY_DN21742_c0_g1_i1.p1  ORF type:complete len:926 (+),score=158.60 TRINITY_DN21742_c0_g1_i1:117-2894(+)
MSAAPERPEWQSDRDAQLCGRCERAFTVLWRRHHCRACGLIFCSTCCHRKVALPHLGYEAPQRVCMSCDSALPSPLERWRHRHNLAGTGADSQAGSGHALTPRDDAGARSSGLIRGRSAAGRGDRTPPRSPPPGPGLSPKLHPLSFHFPAGPQATVPCVERPDSGDGLGRGGETMACTVAVSAPGGGGFISAARVHSGGGRGGEDSPRSEAGSAFVSAVRPVASRAPSSDDTPEDSVFDTPGTPVVADASVKTFTKVQNLVGRIFRPSAYGSTGTLSGTPPRRNAITELSAALGSPTSPGAPPSRKGSRRRALTAAVRDRVGGGKDRQPPPQQPSAAAAGWAGSGRAPEWEVRLVIHEARSLGKRRAVTVLAQLCGIEMHTGAARSEAGLRDGVYTWEEAFAASVTDPAADLHILVCSDGVVGENTIGRACVPLSLLFNQPGWAYEQLWLELLPLPADSGKGWQPRKYRAPRAGLPRGELPGTMRRPKHTLGFICVSVSFKRAPLCTSVAWLTAPAELSEQAHLPREASWDSALLAYHWHRVQDSWHNWQRAPLLLWIAVGDGRRRAAAALWGLLCMFGELWQAPLVIAALFVVNGVVHGQQLATQYERVLVFQEDNDTEKPGLRQRVKSAAQMPQRFAERLLRLQDSLGRAATVMEKTQHCFAFDCDPAAASASALLIFGIATAAALAIALLSHRLLLFFVGAYAIFRPPARSLPFGSARLRAGLRVRLVPPPRPERSPWEGRPRARYNATVIEVRSDTVLLLWDAPESGGPPWSSRAPAPVSRKWWDGSASPAVLDGSWSCAIRELRISLQNRLRDLSHTDVVRRMLQNLWSRLPDSLELEHRKIAESQQVPAGSMPQPASAANRGASVSPTPPQRTSSPPPGAPVPPLRLPSSPRRALSPSKRVGSTLGRGHSAGELRPSGA